MFLIYVSFVHMISIASIRYRFILEWILIIFASYSLNYFYKKIKNSKMTPYFAIIFTPIFLFFQKIKKIKLYICGFF